MGPSLVNPWIHDGPWGHLMGGPQCRLSILRNGNVPCRDFKHFLVDFKMPQCRLSILRNGNVPCHYLLNDPVDFKVVQCSLSHLRTCHVVLSNLRVNDPTMAHLEGTGFLNRQSHFVTFNILFLWVLTIFRGVAGAGWCLG